MSLLLQYTQGSFCRLRLCRKLISALCSDEHHSSNINCFKLIAIYRISRALYIVRVTTVTLESVSDKETLRTKLKICDSLYRSFSTSIFNKFHAKNLSLILVSEQQGLLMGERLACPTRNSQTCLPDSKPRAHTKYKCTHT